MEDQYILGSMNVLYHAMLSLREKPAHENRLGNILLHILVMGGASQHPPRFSEHAKSFLAM